MLLLRCPCLFPPHTHRVRASYPEQRDPGQDNPNDPNNILVPFLVPFVVWPSISLQPPPASISTFLQPYPSEPRAHIKRGTQCLRLRRDRWLIAHCSSPIAADAAVKRVPACSTQCVVERGRTAATAVAPHLVACRTIEL